MILLLCYIFLVYTKIKLKLNLKKLNVPLIGINLGNSENYQ